MCQQRSFTILNMLKIFLNWCLDGCWHSPRILKRAGEVGAATGSAPKSFRSLLSNPQSHMRMTDLVIQYTPKKVESHFVRLLLSIACEKAAHFVSNAPPRAFPYGVLARIASPAMSLVQRPWTIGACEYSSRRTGECQRPDWTR